MPVLKSPDTASPHTVVHWQTGSAKEPQWAIRQGDWKLIGNPRDTSNSKKLGDDDEFFLVNLQRDATEMKNIASENPDVVKRLRKLHDSWVQEVNLP